MMKNLGFCLHRVLKQRLPGTRYRDGIVMRVGLGWEKSNEEAFLTWQMGKLSQHDEEAVAVEIEGGLNGDAFFNPLILVLRDQALWVMADQTPPFPDLHPFLLSRQLTELDHYKMAHALYELLSQAEPEPMLEGGNKQAFG